MTAYKMTWLENGRPASQQFKAPTPEDAVLIANVWDALFEREVLTLKPLEAG